MDWEPVPRGPTTSDSNDPLWDGKTVRRHRHHEFELAVVLEGDGFVETVSRSLPVNEGSVIWVAPGVDHAMRRTSRLLALATIHSGPLSPHLRPMLPSGLAADGVEVTRLSELALKDFWALYENCRALLPDEERVIADESLWTSWLNIFLAFVRKQAGSSHTVRSVAQVADHLAQHPGADLTVLEMAHWAGFSEARFRQLFHELYQVSPKEFQTRCRLRAAKERLETSQKPIAQIADQLGFESPSAFSTWFRKMTGASPSEWRDHAWT